MNEITRLLLAPREQRYVLYDKLLGRFTSTGAWLIRYCKEHKCPSFNVYSPKNAQFVILDHHGMTFRSKFEPWMNEFMVEGER